MALQNGGIVSEAEQPSEEEEFEEVVAAALKVDPKGLSGKHRREAEESESDEAEESP